MKRRTRALVRLGRRKARHVIEKVMGGDFLSSGYMSPQMHENLQKANEARKDIRP